MSPLGACCVAGWLRFPRVSGDEPLNVSVRLVRTVFSPRERG